MSSSRPGQVRGFHFYLREEVCASWNSAGALQFLGRFRGDAGALGELRSAIARRTGLTAPDSEDKLLQLAAQLLVSGQLVMVMPRVRLPAPVTTEAPREIATVVGRKLAKELDVPDDEATFGGNLNAALQAASLVAAAETGVPFCEECERMAKQQAAA